MVMGKIGGVIFITITVDAFGFTKPSSWPT